MRWLPLALGLLVACGAQDPGSPDGPVGADAAADAADAPDAGGPGYRLAATYPHDPQAFTQGLLVDGDHLLEGTGLQGQSSLRRVSISTGAVLAEVALPSPHFGEGITRFGDLVYQLTWQTETCFVYAADTFAPAGSFTYDGEGWGLTHDGVSLIMSDGSAVLTFRDPVTFAPQRTLTVRDGGAAVFDLNELEWVRGEIWANVWLEDRIARIDPATGNVIGWLALSALVPPETQDDSNAVLNGIAYDAARDRVYVTGKLWPVLYELEILWP